MTDEAKPEKTPEQVLKGLERKASQAALIKAGEPHIVALCKAYADVLSALGKLVDTTAAQKNDAEAAQNFAAANGLETTARELGRAPLIAAVVYALADVPPPPRDADGHFVLPQAWLKQFSGDGAAQARAQTIQKLLNGGTILSVEGLTDEQVARELLAGRNPNSAAPKYPKPEIRNDAPGWYGFRGNQNAVTALPDSNLPNVS